MQRKKTYYYCINKIPTRRERSLFFRGIWAKNLGFSCGTREVSGHLEHEKQGCSLPQIFEKPLSPVALRWWEVTDGCCGRLGLGKQFSRARRVHGIDKCNVPLAGLQLWLGRWKEWFRFIQSGECKASLGRGSWELLVKAERWTCKQKC